MLRRSIDARMVGTCPTHEVLLKVWLAGTVTDGQGVPTGACYLKFEEFQTCEGSNVSHHELEKDLTHLEHIVPRLVATSALGLVYWRSRVTALRSVQALLPDGARRVARLLSLFDQIDGRLHCLQRQRAEPVESTVPACQTRPEPGSGRGGTAG